MDQFQFPDKMVNERFPSGSSLQLGDVQSGDHWLDIAHSRLKVLRQSIHPRICSKDNGHWLADESRIIEKTNWSIDSRPMEISLVDGVVNILPTSILSEIGQKLQMLSIEMLSSNGTTPPRGPPEGQSMEFPNPAVAVMALVIVLVVALALGGMTTSSAWLAYIGRA